MSQRVHPWTRWSPAERLVPSQSGSGAVLIPSDVPPVIISTPSPLFVAGDSLEYDMKPHVLDDGQSAVTYALSGVLPVWLTFNPITGILLYDGTGAIVDVKSTNVIRLDELPAICFAGIRFASSGAEYQSEDLGSAFITSPGSWLEFGVAAGVWVERFVSVTSGQGLNWFDPGPGRISCDTNPTYGTQRAALGSNIIDLTFSFYDAPVGGVLLHSKLVTLAATTETDQ